MTSHSPTILITDDDEGHTILIEENLRAAGLDYPVLTFTDGRDLLDFLHGVHPKHRYDPARSHILLLDIRMPRMDGVETLRHIKTDPRFRRLPVIVLTTTDDSREVSRAYEYGCACYLAKPVDYSRFAESVQQLGRFIKLMEIPRMNEPRP